MKLLFENLDTPNDFISISWTGQENDFIDYSVEDAKKNGITFSKIDCPDISKALIKGKFNTFKINGSTCKVVYDTIKSTKSSLIKSDGGLIVQGLPKVIGVTDESVIIDTTDINYSISSLASAFTINASDGQFGSSVMSTINKHQLPLNNFELSFTESNKIVKFIIEGYKVPLEVKIGSFHDLISIPIDVGIIGVGTASARAVISNEENGLVVKFINTTDGYNSNIVNSTSISYSIDDKTYSKSASFDLPYAIDVASLEPNKLHSLNYRVSNMVLPETTFSVMFNVSEEKLVTRITEL